MEGDDRRCPRCGRPVPANEWASYRRCEDCFADGARARGITPGFPPSNTKRGRRRNPPRPPDPRDAGR